MLKVVSGDPKTKKPQPHPYVNGIALSNIDLYIISDQILTFFV